MKSEKKIIAISVVFGLFTWFLDAMLDYVFFYEGSFPDLLIVHVPKHEVYIRLVILLCFVVFGIIVSRIMAERKKAERELVDSERKWRNILVNTPQIGVSLNPNAEIVFANEHFMELTGWTEQETIGRDWFETFIPEENREEIRNVFFSVMNQKHVHGFSRYENDIVTRNGELRHVSWANVLSKDAHGNVSDVTCLGIDLSERKRAEEALVRKEEEQRATLYGIGDAVMSTDFEGLVARMNPMAEQMTGWTEYEAAGKPLEEVFHIINEQTRLRVENPVKQVLREGKIVGLANHTLLVSRGGREIPIADSGAPIFDSHGSVTGVVLVFRDQTEERLNQRLIETRLSLIEFAAKNSLDELLTRTLDEVGRFVDSPIGFFHFVAFDQQTLSPKRWSSRTLKEFCRTASKGASFNIREAGVWADCVREKKPVIHNDYASLPNKKGLPDGHAEVIRELVVPVMREGKVVAILGVGNKPEDYSKKDVEIVSYLADVSWEIVRRKRAEEAFKESERLLNTTGEMGKIGGWEHDLSTGKAVWTKALYDIVEIPYDRDPPGAEEHLSYYPPRDREMLEKAYNLAVEKGEPFDLELQCHTANQKIFWCRAQGEPVFKDGKCVKMRGIFQDITERKQAEEALKESESFIRAVMDNLPIGVAVSSTPPSVEFLYLNDNFTKFYRTTREALHGLDVFWEAAYEDPKFSEEMKNRVRDDCASGDPEKMIWENVPITRKGQETTYISARNIPVPEKKMMISTVWDVTDRNRAEEALRKSEEKFFFLFHSSPDWIALNEMWSGRFFEANKAFEKITGFTSEEAIGKTPFELNLWPDPKDRARFIEKLQEEGNLYNYEVRLRMKNGEHRDFLWSVERVKLEGQDCTVNVLRDITEQKIQEAERYKLEEQLRQSQKMEAIGTLAGGIAHDFNNILWGMIGFTEMSLIEAPKGSELEDNLNQVLSAGHRAKELVRQILAFSRMSEKERRPVDIRPIVNEALKLLRASIPSTIEIDRKIERRQTTILADPTQIHQVVLNLCTNAVHAMEDEGGVLQVTMEPVVIESSQVLSTGEITEGHYVRLSVSDTGTGMDSATLERLFNPYFTTKSKGTGTGLGLAVVHGIVQSHGGFIDVSSEPGKGSVFDVYFPRVDKEIALSKKDAIPLSKGNERILFVDDEEGLGNLGTRMLGHLGYEVITKTSSMEALDLFRTRHDRFDLVITDLTMPFMTGDKLSEELMKIRPDIPIILCTGYGERLSEDKIRKLGIKALLIKPIELEELSGTVRRALDETKTENTV